MTKKVNFRKILANAGTVFFTVLTGITTSDIFLDLNLDIYQKISVAVVPAIIQAGLVFFSEWYKAEQEDESDDNPDVPVDYISILNRILVFFRGFELTDFLAF